MLHPITFSIPGEKICNGRQNKTKILSSLIPGDSRIYIYNTEKDYYDEYKKSYFAITMKKAGWDCMRHYEILANGCIPYFIDIENCPPNTMYLLPKLWLIEANQLYSIFQNKQINELTEEEIDAYYTLQSKLLEYTRMYLTTDKVATYVLQRAKHTHATKILYLSGDLFPDYLRCLTLHGFKMLFGKKCHDYPKVKHLYKSYTIDSNRLYGKGITYSKTLDDDLHNNEQDDKIMQYIYEKYYDVIIYGSFHRGLPYYELISSIYEPHKIIFLCGEDIHPCCYQPCIDRGHTIFVREL